MHSLQAWINMPLNVWLACSAALMLGAFVQRATGFGLAIIAAPLLLMLEPRLVPVVLVLFVFTVSLLMVRHYWQEIRLGAIGVALIGCLPGNALGVWLLLAAPIVVLEKLIAAIVLFAVVVTLFRFHPPVNRLTLFIAGVLSGIFGTVAAMGGPPIALLMHGFPLGQLRGNLAAFFILTSLLTLTTLALAGQVSAWHFKLALTFLPAVLIGNMLAHAVAHRLDRRLLQGVTLGLCMLAALGLLI
ncbi:sulfite exporter TauE/SafE family protein [Vreelandella andesensis]|uniref:Probable membrane transporter protein n=1 Tax=Vreelandella andesensis TaxID=447567 RepID=A0A433KW70_9GAMM|nr:sulfite exporter TauE/SafE family protein [Halomonas andesensis]RUR33939.1 sulfite exporter TauE/SafE family protein [Halomonas andesensis]